MTTGRINQVTIVLSSLSLLPDESLVRATCQKQTMRSIQNGSFYSAMHTNVHHSEEQPQA